MTPQLQAVRALSTLAVRKWAAEVLTPPAPQPVVPTPVPLPDGALEPMTQAPMAAQPPVKPSNSLESIAGALVSALPNANQTPVSTPAVPAPAAPSITPPVTPPPSLAAKLPPDRTVDQPVPAAAIPPGKGAPAAEEPKPAAPTKSLFQSFADKAHAAQAAIQDKVNSTIDQRLGESIDGLNAMPAGDLMQTAGEFFSDWHNWIAPIGILAAMFGGTTGKVLGALAAVGGGVDLYNRYKGVESLGQTPEGQQLIQSALTFKDAQGKPQPFGNVATLMKSAPDKAQALKDLSLSAKLGLKNMLINRTIETGAAEAEKMGVPASTVINRLVTTKRMTEQQGQEMLKNLEASKQRLAQQAPVAARG